MPHPWSEAWAEAEASVSPSVKSYDTLEIVHSSFVGPLRIVAGVAEDADFTLEDDAPYNAGETVTFKAVDFVSEWPEFAEGQVPESRVTIDNVARYLIPSLMSALAIKADLRLILRRYRSDDTSEPSYGPVEYLMRSVEIVGQSVSGLARLDNLANRRFPNRRITVEDFPGLQT
ncbi:MAG: DUF1833 family protein [Xanthobacteraceae bacterium]